MKKIILAAVNARYTHSCLALYCLKSYARGAGADIAIREYSINRGTAAIAADLAAARPDAVALSVYIWNTELVKEIVPALHAALPVCAIILGGPEVSYNPASWLADFPFIDYVITGQGESAFRRLVEADFLHGEKIISQPNPPFADLPLPYEHGDLDGLAGRYVYYESSRGCPFRCSYCLSSRADQKPEAKSVETVKEELRFILAHGPKLVKFVDRTFNLDRDRYRATWNFLIDEYRSGPTTFHFEIHPAHLDEEDFAILSRCPKGLFQFEIGVQSTNPAARAAVHRGGAWERDHSAIARLVSPGNIHVHLDLIAGLPYDDMDSVARSFNALYALGPHRLQLGFLKVLPGTEMRERADEFRITFAACPPYQASATQWISAEEMRMLERVAVLVERLYNTGRHPVTLSAFAARYGSPFEMYRDLAADTPAGPSTRSREACAEFLLAAAAALFPREKSFFLDALRWDWCSGAGTHRYPAKLRPNDAASIRKKGIAFFSGLAEEGIIRYQGAEFRIADLERAIFFRAESDEFARAYLQGRRCAAFIPGKEVMLFD